MSYAGCLPVRCEQVYEQMSSYAGPLKDKTRFLLLQMIDKCLSRAIRNSE